MKKFLLTTILSAALTGAFAQIDSTAPFHYSTDDYDCAIFPASYTDFVESTGKRFTPGFTDIKKAEHTLAEQLLQQKDTTKRLAEINRHLKKYKRQYFGYIGKDGHKMLYINLFWDDKSYVKDWLKDIIRVDGGGSSYWHIRYDLDADKLSGLEINFDE